MYTLSAYGSMMTDHVRLDAYRTALRRAVQPGSTVLDIGTGVGIFAFLACQCGAKRVFAIEPNDAIEVARQVATSNGYADRIVFIQDLSTNVTLSEPADVMISDLRGVLPLFRRHIPAVIDARQRLLAPGGVCIPLRDTLWVAVVEAPELYRQCMAPWDDNVYGLDWRAVRHKVMNTWQRGRVGPEHIVLAPQPWTILDYTAVTTPDCTGTVHWTARCAGMAHGLSVWFDATLAEGVHFTNAPGATALCYGQAFFPWEQPVAIAAGDLVSVTLHSDLVGEDYVWRWETLVLAQGQPDHIKARFKQSTFYGRPLSPARLRQRAVGGGDFATTTCYGPAIR